MDMVVSFFNNSLKMFVLLCLNMFLMIFLLLLIFFIVMLFVFLFVFLMVVVLFMCFKIFDSIIVVF